MFHLAYLLGSRISTRVVLTKEELLANKESHEVLFLINIVHVCVPVFSLFITICEAKSYYIIARLLEVLSIFIY